MNNYWGIFVPAHGLNHMQIITDATNFSGLTVISTSLLIIKFVEFYSENGVTITAVLIQTF